jgi:hypothetical protein
MMMVTWHLLIRPNNGGFVIACQVPASDFPDPAEAERAVMMGIAEGMKAFDAEPADIPQCNDMIMSRRPPFTFIPGFSCWLDIDDVHGLAAEAGRYAKKHRGDDAT